MDLTALLNGGSLAVEQREREIIRLPTRGRTPWDAGGYSLPLNSMTTGPKQSEHIHQTSSESIINSEDESGMGAAPTSPTHKFTDSRSSLSSFTSSLLSAPHSRLSSVSTVDSTHTLNNDLAGQNLSPKSTASQRFEMSGLSGSLPSEEEKRPASTSGQQSREGLSPTKSLDTLAMIAENHQLGSPNEGSTQAQNAAPIDGHIPRSQGPLSKDLAAALDKDAEQIISISYSAMLDFSRDTDDDLHKTAKGDGTQERADLQDTSWVNAPYRPSSPSDSLLIRRPTLPSLQLNTKGHQPNYYDQVLSSRFLSVDLEPRQNDQPKLHKRALSAPSFAVKLSGPRGARPEQYTPPSSQHPDRESPVASFSYNAPDTPPAATIATETHVKPVCMYITDCDTGSQQRKAISHIFGRNKMCTRLVPDHIWVHLCRKHYQRSRYRNATSGYAQVQCDLVQEQIRRIHEWSLQNRATGLGPYVQNWTLALRKREQKRIEEQNAPKRKRDAFTQEEEDGVTRDEIGYPTSRTAVPDWLLALVGQDFSTHGILDVFNRLHRHIVESTVPFPDVEILPNIVVSQEDSKPVAKSSHQRAQSLTVHHESSFRENVPKRRRQNEILSFDRNMASATMAQRPSYPSINEFEIPEDPYSSYRRSSYQNPLPAPVPQRSNGHSMAHNLEINSARRPDQRPSHNRSQSDMSGFSRGSPQYYGYPRARADMTVSQETHAISAPPSEYLAYRPQEMQHPIQPPQFRNEIGYGQPQGGYRPTAQSVHPGVQLGLSSYQMGPHCPTTREMHAPTMRHSRHFSTPIITQPYKTTPSTPMNHRPSPLPRTQRAPSVPQIREVKEVNEFYLNRR